MLVVFSLFVFDAVLGLVRNIGLVSVRLVCDLGLGLVFPRNLSCSVKWIEQPVQMAGDGPWSKDESKDWSKDKLKECLCICVFVFSFNVFFSFFLFSFLIFFFSLLVLIE